MNDQTIEQEIIAKNLTAPRVTPADIAANIDSEHYFTAADGEASDNSVSYIRNDTQDDNENPQYIYEKSLGLLTFCVLVLKNGFTVTGESACASPKNFDAEIGRKVARQNAVAKIWPLMGYALKERLSQ